jgi:hypothetical protein
VRDEAADEEDAMKNAKAWSRVVANLLCAATVLGAGIAVAEEPKERSRPEPTACKVAADCAKACPPDAKGCGCRKTHHGDMRCTPTCQVDADCPQGRGGRGSCHDGFCKPPGKAGGEGGPRECKTAADCAGACPPEAKGCGCHTTPRGEQKCAPTCQADADCPKHDGEAMSCREGFCRRQHPKEPGAAPAK